MGHDRMLKVAIELEPGAWHGHARETMWAERVGDNRYRLRNVPFYAKGLSFGDVVFAEPDSDGQPLVTGVSLRGGHSTYRVAPSVPVESPSFVAAWKPLKASGCSFEGMEGKLLAVDVPPAANIYDVYEAFERGEHEGVWDFEEGHCGHPLDRGDGS